ncbi:hypothetical protein KY290_033854 [Solanum tuberosum]|uniref:Integrase catalytic domain-containing protein n=1 Tax=Solanum tuberosum TaxID=4113 RepID=A0ABQ7U1X1_SOLTU|nr:hypothetical protein KY290_033854 [Solanum tuberosum]
MLPNTTSKITEDKVATTRDVEEEIVVADKVIAIIRPLKISGPHRTLTRVVKFVMVGASHHITPDLANLHHVEDYNDMDQVQVGNGQGLPIHHTGNSTLSLPSKSLSLTNILHVPSITKCLLSVQRFARDNDVFFEFHPSHFIVKDRASKTPLLSGQSNDGLYSLKLQPSQPRAISKSPSICISSRTSSTCWHLRLVKLKSEVTSIFHQFKLLVENQFHTKIKSIQSDWGGEFRALSPILSQFGISHRVSCPHTHEQQGKVERKHRHIVEAGLSLLAHSSTPSRYWHFAFTLLAPCVFLGYSPKHLGYRCLDRVSGRFYIARHVCFDETIFPFTSDSILGPHPSTLAYLIPWASSLITIPHRPANPVASPPTSNLPNLSSTLRSPVIDQSSSNTNAPSSQPIIPLVVDLTDFSLPHQSTPLLMQHTSQPVEPPQRTHHMRLRHMTPFSYLSTVPSSMLSSPPSTTEANKHKVWRDDMSAEMNALLRNGTWTLVPFNSSMNVLGNKWIFRIKKNTLGNIERYKARLVAKGFHQLEGQDYFETFSPVVKPATIRVVLTVVASRGWQLRQLDKSLYGLKEAPRAWLMRLHQFLIVVGFSPFKTDTSLFVYQAHGVTASLLVYVDDIIVTSSHPSFLESIISTLGDESSIRDLSCLSFFLGVRVRSWVGYPVSIRMSDLGLEVEVGPGSDCV